MAVQSRPRGAHAADRPLSKNEMEDQFRRWGGLAGLAGVAMMLLTMMVTVVWDLPDASDVETLTDFDDIRWGRLAEHLLYLGALTAFALHDLVLHRITTTAHAAAALFGTALMLFGLVVMMASSMLHLSTDPLDELRDAATSEEEREMVTAAWHGAQSVFDTMLATGLLLVPLGMVLSGLAMRRARTFGRRIGDTAIGLGVVAFAGAMVAVVDPGSMFSALAVLALVVFHAVTAWPLLTDGPGARSSRLPARHR